jgi:hypothetical protein
MSKRISSKETLAKLMATENIFVEHANVPTAGFDLINRRLLLPNWKNISDDVYTLLISHEVGHALYTPTQEWEDAILKSKDMNLKQVVNIVEDVRIEKLIQQKFPGTTRAFRSGYDELEKSNLFGTKNREIDSYGLLDRLNLHFKIGHFGYANVPFSDKERSWLDRVSSCKSFADVLKVAQELMEFVDQNPESQGDPQQNQNGEGESSENVQMSENGEPGENQLGGQQSRSRSLRGQRSDDEEQKSQSAGGQMGDQKSNEQGEDTDSDKASSQSENAGNISETQKHFDSAIQGLVDRSISDTKYANFPEIQLNKLVVPYKTVHEQITSFYSNYYTSMYAQAQQQVDQFRNGSKNIVNQLANIFEMKKKAKLDVKALTAKTGKLDMNRVHSYRYNDDVFKKITTVPQGKNHGLVMFIDMSSSMSENLAGTFEQLLNLVLFCKRVNIPFDVYGFTDSYAARRNLPAHPTNNGSLYFDPHFCLRQYFSSRMSGHEFNAALQNVICIMRHYSGQLMSGLPSEEILNTTPLVPTIMTAIPLVQKFRNDYNLDIVNTIFLTDGEDTHGLLYHSQTGDSKYFACDRYGFNRITEKYYVRDVKTRKQWEIKNTTNDMLNILRETAGVKTIGFHIIRKRDVSHVVGRYTKNSKEEQEHVECFKNNKFAEMTNIPGYDAYYLIPSGSSLNVGDDEFEGTVDTTVDWNDEKQAKKAIKVVQKNFNNFMKQKVTSRILLNRFIEHIS